MSLDEPLPWSTFPEMLHGSVGRHGSLEAVVDGEVRLDFAALQAAAGRLAGALHARGVGAGDRVAIWGSNAWRWVVAACGTWQLGAALVPVASRWKAAEVAPLLARTGARVLFGESQAAGQPLLPALAAHLGAGEADRPLGGLPDLECIVRLDVGSEEVRIAHDWEGFVASGHDVPIPDASRVSPDDLAEILFTSGTTGSPKGVELRHRQLLQSYWDWSGVGGLRGGDRFLVIPPYSHGFGINGGILACLMRGVTNVPMAVFDPQTTLELVARERISVISGPPTLFATLMNLPDFEPAKVASLRLAFVGAASVPTELIQRMQDRMGIERVCNAYGLIESCVISMTRADDPPEVISTTTGRALPGVEVRIVDEAGNVLGSDQSGEIQVRSEGVTSGYWRDPEQTAAAITPEGWLHTGDVGEMDAEGHLRIVDRLKDAYNCGGFSAYPAEIESQLLQREEIAAVAVVGVPDERLGEVGHAFIVPAANCELDVDAIHAWARENMANYKLPRRIWVVDALPLNATGKVRKDELRARASQARQVGGSA